MGVGVSVAEECGEEVDLRGRGFLRWGPVLLDPASECGMT